MAPLSASEYPDCWTPKPARIPHDCHSRLIQMRSMKVPRIRFLVAKTPLMVAFNKGLVFLTLYKMMASVVLARLLSCNLSSST